MSCTFWLRRKKLSAQKQAEVAKQVKETEGKVFGEEPVTEVKPKTAKKTTKKAVTSDDNA